MFWLEYTYHLLSTDPRPTVGPNGPNLPVGCEVYEVDTGNKFHWNGSAWVASPATTGGPATVANGADAAQGAIADAIVDAGAVGTLSAKMRRATQGLENLKSLLVLAAGTNLIGKVGIDQTTPGTTNKVSLQDISDAIQYETVAASQTAQVLGSTGAVGDYLKGLLVIPDTTSPGQVLLLDNATSITVFTGGAVSTVDLKPFFIPLAIKSVSGAWKVTTGLNISVIAVGKFT